MPKENTGILKESLRETVLWTVRSVIIGMRFAERTTGAAKSAIIGVCRAEKSSKEALSTTVANVTIYGRGNGVNKLCVSWSS